MRDLQHLLLGWELMGESQREAFTRRLREYANFYLEHMRAEEEDLLPAAEAVLTEGEWAELAEAFSRNRDPLAGGDPRLAEPPLRAHRAFRPSAVGLGPSLNRVAEEQRRGA